MRVLGKENEELQQHVRELNEALKNSNESKQMLVSNHEVCILLVLVSICMQIEKWVFNKC